MPPLQSTEDAVHQLLCAGIADDRVLDILLPSGAPVQYETELWDFKLGYARSTPENLNAEEVCCEIVKDVVSFHNAYGGYLLIGLPPFFSELAFNIITDHDKFTQKLDRFSGKKIEVRFHRKRRSVEDSDVDLLLIQVPRRKETTPVYFRREASHQQNNKPAFRQNEIYVRDRNGNVRVNDNPGLIQFCVGDRRYTGSGYTPAPAAVTHNLPPRDSNLLRFVGRDEYLEQLWRWLVDARNPVKVLTAIGGTGETAIAYEFCERIIRNGGLYFEKVIWLSAKREAFAALLDKRIETARTDFHDVESFLNSLLLELACTTSDLDEYVSADEKQDDVLLMLKTHPVLLVVDDVDFLDIEDQHELFSVVSRIFNQAASARNQSKVLLTSRLELPAGMSQMVWVSGFKEDEAREYVDIVTGHLALTDNWKTHIWENFATLYGASKGSPIFLSSILRLVSMGEDLGRAIRHWQDRLGEDVRRYAFKKEIGLLPWRCRRALYAMQILGETTPETLSEVLNEDLDEIIGHLVKLKQYHLFTSHADPSTGSLLSVPEPVRLVVSVTAAQIQPDDLAEIQRRCSEIKARGGDYNPELIEVRRVFRLWEKGFFAAAQDAAKQALVKFPRSGDLSFALGRSLMSLSPPALSEADEAFKEAFLKQCCRPELLECWAEAKYRLGDIRGLIAISEPKQRLPVRGAATAYRLAALYRLARQCEEADDCYNAQLEYINVFDEGRRVLMEGRAEAAELQVRRTMHAAAQYAIETALDLAVGNPRKKDRAFELCYYFYRHGDANLGRIEDVVGALEEGLQWKLVNRLLDRSILDRRRAELGEITEFSLARYGAKSLKYRICKHALDRLMAMAADRSLRKEVRSADDLNVGMRGSA